MSHKTAAVILLAAVAAILMLHIKPSQETSFEQWKVEHGKTYPSQFEEAYRKTVFLKNAAEVAAHNADSSNTHQKGINQFSDLTQDEFVAKYLTLKVKPSSVHGRTMQDSGINGDIDWSAAGMVTPVKNQAQCGSCWAFSAVAAHESALLLTGQPSISLSEQQLVDCSKGYGNQGCNGGWMDSAFQYVKAQGLTTTAAYPYAGRDQACAINSGAYKISGFVDVPGCDNLLNALSARPISVAVDASVWSSYRSGVLSNCGTAVNHGVLLVGATDAYWRIKNSWSASWGESGFIRIARGNTCAVCGYPSYPTL